jgi:hypothetical protein
MSKDILKLDLEFRNFMLNIDDKEKSDDMMRKWANDCCLKQNHLDINLSKDKDN